MSIQTNTLLLFCLTFNSIGLAQPIRWSAQDGGNDHWYQLAPTRLVWDDARDYAKSVGGRLVTVNDQTEQDWLVATFGNPSSRWTGLRYDNRLQGWRWSSGEAFSFTTWAPGEPNGFGPFPWSENYAVIWDQFGGSWCDYPSPVYNPGGPGEFRTEFNSIIEWKPCVADWISLQAMTGTGFADTAAVYDPIREEIVVVGGQSGGPGTNQARVYRDEIWETFAAPSDDALNHTACSYDRTRGVSVFFGGLLNGSPSDRTLEWDGLSWSSQSGGPSPRYDAAMAFDELRGRIVLFGGSTGGGFDGETWEWDGSDWQQLSAAGPSPRAASAMAWDVERQRTILFGGYNQSGVMGDTWEWNGSVWTRASTTGPSARANHAMATDRKSGRVVVHGGGGFTDLWELGTSGWTLINAGLATSARSAHSLVFDEQSERLVSIGGYTSSGIYTPEVLAISPLSEVTLVVSPNRQRVDVGGAATFRAEVVPAQMASFRWELNNLPLTDDARVAGSATSELVISNLRSSDAGLYRVIATGICSEVVSMSARLSVTCRVDFNDDNFVDFFDYDDFVTCYELGQCPPSRTSDFNGDGFVDFFDYDGFVEAFETGC